MNLFQFLRIFSSLIGCRRSGYGVCGEDLFFFFIFLFLTLKIVVMVFIIKVIKRVCRQLRTLELCKKALFKISSPEGKSNIRSMSAFPVTCLKSVH